MGLTKSVLKRPVTVVMVILCLIVFGLQSVLGAKLELMPTMEMPVLIVYSVYPGASPEDVNDLVSTKIEKEIGSLSGVDTIQSRSMENVSLVIIRYCGELGIPVEERAFTLEELYTADEILVTSTSHPSMRAMELNKRAVGMKNPELIQKLRDKYLSEIGK